MYLSSGMVAHNPYKKQLPHLKHTVLWCLLDRASLWWLTNENPNRCHLLLLFYFLDTHHVWGINMPIFRTLRLCCWTTTLAVSFLICCVLELGCGSARMVSRLPVESQQPACSINESVSFFLYPFLFFLCPLCIYIFFIYIYIYLFKRREESQLDANEWSIALIICSTCFGHIYARHQELETILVLLLHMVCNALVAGGRWSGAGQQAMRPGWGILFGPGRGKLFDCSRTISLIPDA